MDAAQLVTFGNDIRNNTDQTVIDALASNNPGVIAEWYSQQASPDFWIFKQSVDTDTVRDSLVASETAADEDAATNPGLNSQQRWHFDLLMHNGHYNPAKRVSRDLLVKIFPSHMTGTRNKIISDATTRANRIEKLLAVTLDGPGGGNGSAPTSAAGATHFGGVSWIDVDQALQATQS